MHFFLRRESTAEPGATTEPQASCPCEAGFELLYLFASTPPSHHRAAVHGAAIAGSQGVGPLYAAHDTLGCQFTNGPVGLCFHAHTCSV